MDVINKSVLPHSFFPVKVYKILYNILILCSFKIKKKKKEGVGLVVANCKLEFHFFPFYTLQRNISLK